jgi:hypothetical protein
MNDGGIGMERGCGRLYKRMALLFAGWRRKTRTIGVFWGNVGERDGGSRHSRAPAPSLSETLKELRLCRNFKLRRAPLQFHRLSHAFRSVLVF